MTKSTIRAKERDAVIQSMRAGVVPRAGQHLIQVGRAKEIQSLISDIERISEGGSTFRLVTGAYGAGKTFFLQLVRSIAMEKKLVVANADLNPDRRLHATGGQAKSLYAELMRNLSTRTKPDGGALPGIVEKFISTAIAEAKDQNIAVEKIIRQKLDHLSEMVNGYDFSDVIAAYYRGFEEGDDTLKQNAIRWLRGEFSTKTDAKNALGVRSIVDDAEIYDQLKLMARFVQLAGFSGLLINLDEMVNIYKMANTQARNSNYEQLLRILNDSLQGTAGGLGFIMGATPESLMDTRRGIYSYSALESRLAQNSFVSDGVVDFTGPVVQLSALTQEDFYMLLDKVRHVYSSGDEEKYLIPDEGIVAFMEHCSNKIGNAYFRTPRTTITAFVNLLAVLEQNPKVKWSDLLGRVKIEVDAGGTSDIEVEDDELTAFTL